MNKHIARTLVVIATLTVAHPFEGSQDAAARAAAVLAEARKALGGEEKLRNVKTLQASGDLRRSMGEMQLEGELEVLIEAPDKMRREETIAAPGGGSMVRTEVLNGNEVWDDSSRRGGMGGHMMVFRGPGGREMTEDELKEMRLRARRVDLSRLMLAWLLTTDAAATHAGIAEAPDGSADVLEMTGAEAPPTRMFIDRQTHLPLMLTWRGPQRRMIVRRGPGGGPPNPEQAARDAEAEGPPAEATYEMRFDDYRSVDGIQLPHQISRAMDGTVNEEWSIKSYKVNASFKNNTFTK